MAMWTFSVIAQGAAASLMMQISDSEQLGFECSAKGVSVFAKLQSGMELEEKSKELELSIGGTKLKLSTIYMLETGPPLWVGDFESADKILALLKHSDKLEVMVPSRAFSTQLDSTKTTEFIAACTKLAAGE